MTASPGAEPRAASAGAEARARPPVLEARGLSKWYGEVMGLNDVDVTIGPGVTGLLGPNGAGKTTLLRLMSGQLEPSQGAVRLLGEPVWNNRRALARIGFCPDEDAFYDLSGLEFVTALARVSGVPWAEARERAAATLERVGMADAMHRRVLGYSKGMRQRTKLAQAIVHDPEVLFLDEPLTGADPVGRRDLRRMVAKLAEDGKHVVLSSHVLHEVESLTETIVLVHRGRVLASGNIHAIRDLMDEHPRRVVVRCDRPRDLARALVGADHVVGLELGADALTVETTDGPTFFDALPGLLLDGGHAVEEVYADDEDLSAVFGYLVGRG